MMRSRTGVIGNGSERFLVVEVPRGTSRNTRPDPEVPVRAKRRRFTAHFAQGPYHRHYYKEYCKCPQ